MKRWMCKGKIHRATVTESNLEYEGSIFLCKTLMQEANIFPFEMVQITSLTNAARWKTYAVPVKEEGKVALNGPPAHLFKPGDLVVILSTILVETAELHQLKPQILIVDDHNIIKKKKKIENLLDEWDN